MKRHLTVLVTVFGLAMAFFAPATAHPVYDVMTMTEHVNLTEPMLHDLTASQAIAPAALQPHDSAGLVEAQEQTKTAFFDNVTHGGAQIDKIAARAGDGRPIAI